MVHYTIKKNVVKILRKDGTNYDTRAYMRSFIMVISKNYKIYKILIKIISNYWH